ncbi:hypothetical protein ACJX0J_028305, partial [Zea mays]
WSFEGIKRGDTITGTVAGVSNAIDNSKPANIVGDVVFPTTILWHMRLGHMSDLDMTECIYVSNKVMKVKEGINGVKTHIEVWFLVALPIHMGKRI